MSEQAGGTPSAPDVDQPEGDQEPGGSAGSTGGTPHPDVDQPEGGEDAGAGA